MEKHANSLSLVWQRSLSWESYRTFCHSAFLLYGLTAALSIAVSQIVLVAVILYWGLLQCTLGSSLEEKQGELRSFLSLYGVPVLLWIVLAAVACIVGLDPSRSFLELYKTALYLLLPFAVASALLSPALSEQEMLSRVFKYGRNFLIGSCIASVHTIASTARGVELPVGVPGGLTEAGQLVLFIPLALFALFELQTRKPLSRTYLALGVCFGLSLLLFAWPQVGSFLYSEPSFLIVQVLAGISLIGLFAHGAWKLKQGRKDSKDAHLLYFSLLASSLLFGALLFNLKRGPWSAVIAELCLIGLLFSRRLLLASIGSSVLLLTLVEPIQNRLASLLDHFLIHGGRSSMWTLGVEMAGRFPLGVGLDNARYMRTLDPTMPETHLHMHNNFINITVETGFLGLAVFLWWNILMIVLGVTIWNSSRASQNMLFKQAGRLAAFLAITLFAWQVSGLVEYNFGDGEIRLVGLFLMGIVLALSRFLPANASSPQ